ncbi:sialidase family protein [Membranihabitans maritimus]|uniref:sialidase family protein n=1 Tax=Membranihabitans maritimus TaxID=2904244 RepID=UPI001F4894D5|nr:sialidase family protein [Membranihabitans maritimus]
MIYHKFNFLFFCVFFQSIFLQGQNKINVEESEQPPFFEIKEIFHGERFPNIIVTTKGTVLAIWGRETVRVKRSEDGGNTWSHEITIGRGLHGGGAIVDDNTGRVFVFVEEKHPPAKSKMYISDDDGISWHKKAIKITENSLGHIPSMHMNEAGITLKYGKYKGRIIKPTRYYGKGNDRPFWDDHYTNAMYSDDHGDTWQTSEPFPATGTGEAAIVELSNGTLYYNSRRHKSTDGRDPKRRHTAISEDGGKTWMDLKVVSELPDGDQGRDYGLMAGLTKLSHGDKDLLLFSNIISDDIRKNGFVWVSEDDGKTWPYKKLIDAGSFAYSSMTYGKDNSPSAGYIYLFYEGAENGRVARFNIPWLLSE